MSKTVIGGLLMLVAVANIIWAAKIYDLKSKGNTENDEKKSREVTRLLMYSKISYFITIFLAGIFLWRDKT